MKYFLILTILLLGCMESAMAQRGYPIFVPGKSQQEYAHDTARYIWYGIRSGKTLMNRSVQNRYTVEIQYVRLNTSGLMRDSIIEVVANDTTDYYLIIAAKDSLQAENGPAGSYSYTSQALQPGDTVVVGAGFYSSHYPPEILSMKASGRHKKYDLSVYLNNEPSVKQSLIREIKKNYPYSINYQHLRPYFMGRLNEDGYPDIILTDEVSCYVFLSDETGFALKEYLRFDQVFSFTRYYPF